MRKSQNSAVFIYGVSETRNHVEKCAHVLKEVSDCVEVCGCLQTRTIHKFAWESLNEVITNPRMACKLPEIRTECCQSTSFIECICLLREGCYGSTHARLEVFTVVLLQIRVFGDIVMCIVVLACFSCYLDGLLTRSQFLYF